jgi:excisionase family DNA binding protein
MTPFQTVEEFAEYLNVSPATVRAWIRLGVIPALHVKSILRIDPQEAVGALKAYNSKKEDETPVV